MRAKFKRFGISDIISGFLIAFAMICGVTFAVVAVTEYLTAAVIYGVLTVILTVGAVIVCSLHGVITADGKGVYVVHTLRGRTVRKRIIDYSSIKAAKCGVETEIRRRWGGLTYKMTLTVIMKDGYEMEFYDILDIDSDFPVKQPDKYKQYLHEQPLMKLSGYIGSRLNLDTSV